MQTRSNLTGDLSLACSMRNFGRWSRTAVWSSIGMLTSPNEIDPFQSARGILQTSDFRLQTSDFRFPTSQFPLGFHPVLELLPVAAAPFEISLIGAEADVVFAGLGCHGRRLGRHRVERFRPGPRFGDAGTGIVGLGADVRCVGRPGCAG